MKDYVYMVILDGHRPICKGSRCRYLSGKLDDKNEM